jgi:hypothetical protein
MTDFKMGKIIGARGPQGPIGPTGPTGPSGSSSGSSSNSSEFQINIPNQLTKIKKTINFSDKGTITESDIICSLDNQLLKEYQTYTFGPSITNRWVSVGQGTNDTIAYSNDGINWTGLGKTIFTNSGNGVVWNGSMWVAVGEGNLGGIAYSDDGINWLPATLPDNGGFSKGNGITCHEFGWIAVGKSNGTNKCFIQFSEDGINWISSDKEFTDQANGVACNGKIFVVVGTSGASVDCIVCSEISAPNKINFTTSIINPDSNGDPVLVTSMKSVAWNGKMWVAVGSCILTSFDGINWNKRFPLVGGPNYSSTFQLNTVAWNGNVWVVGGKLEIAGTPVTPLSSFAYSYDGFNWMQHSTTIPILTEVCSVEWNGSSWIGIGDDNYSYSRDGISWIKNNSAFVFTKGYGVSYNSARQNKIIFPYQKLYVSGERGYITSNIIENNWTSIDPDIPDIVFNGAAIGGDRELILADFISNFNSCMVLFYKNPYKQFTIITQTYSTRANAAAWNGKIWVSVGEGGNTIMYSNNAENWNAINNIFSISGNGVAYNANGWVAVGKDISGKNIAYSDNGTGWTKSNTTIFNNGGKGLAHNGERWVAVGADSNGETIYYSNDNGSSWTPAAGSFSTSGNGVAWNGSIWVAVGKDSNTNNNILTSLDGANWSSAGANSFAIQGNSVVWVKDRWLAGGEGTNTMYSSTNGTIWSVVTNPLTKITNLSTNLNTSFIDIPNPITVNKNDKMDIVSGAYYNNSYTNFSCNIKPTFDSN